MQGFYLGNQGWTIRVFPWASWISEQDDHQLMQKSNLSDIWATWVLSQSQFYGLNVLFKLVENEFWQLISNMNADIEHDVIKCWHESSFQISESHWLGMGLNVSVLAHSFVGNYLMREICGDIIYTYPSLLRLLITKTAIVFSFKSIVHVYGFLGKIK